MCTGKLPYLFWKKSCLQGTIIASTVYIFTNIVYIQELVVDSSSAPDTEKIHTDITDHTQKSLLTFKFY